MDNVRLIARLDIKGPNLIKGVHLEGLRVIGDPEEHASRYYDAGADELLYVDIVASLYGRNSLVDIVRHTAANIFVPMTVAGGIRSVDDVTTLLRAGADKVAINTAAVARPELITDVSQRFGAQCMVLSIEAKRARAGYEVGYYDGSTDVRWEAYTDNGREHTDLDVVQWARRGYELGAGEILLTSVDQEGTREGMDVDLIRAVADAVPIPVIASGGVGRPADLVDAVRAGHADAVAVADALHYQRYDLPTLRQHALDAGLPLRRV